MSQPRVKTPLVEIHNVSIRYRIGRPWSRKFHVALEDISLRLEHGEKLGVVGRNGAGKSTLMRICAGILAPDSGRVELDTNRALMLSLQVGFKRHLTGAENAVLSGLYQGLGRSEIEEKMPEIREYSELGEKFESPLGTYSVGMRARLGVSIALHCQPELLILDEVFAVGDRIFREKSRKTMLEKIRSENSVILAAHDNTLIQEICDHVIWLHEGRIQLEGTPEEVLPRYDDFCKDQQGK